MIQQSKTKLLVVEDEPGLAKQLKWGLSDRYEVLIAGNRTDALSMVETEKPPLISLDLGLPPDPDGTSEGFLIMRELLDKAPDTKVVVVTGSTDKESAFRAVELGAYDYYSKPIDLQELKVILSRATRLQTLEEENRKLRDAHFSGNSFEEMIGAAQSMMRLFETAMKVARTDYSVLIQGESGTGKERLAKAIYNLSPRRGKPLVIINCGAIPENLLESELFGHEKGSFTGAHTARPGKLEVAHKGTAILDEVGDLPLQLQVKLLRFLQEGTLERIGARTPIQVDVRVIASTNVDLKEAVERERFREDLYYRLNVVPLVIPPLRDRKEDIVLLARFFLLEAARENKIPNKRFSPGCLEAMLAHAWPGNVRELQNRIKRALIMSDSSEIRPSDMDLGISSEDGLTTLREARDHAELNAIVRALNRNDFNISRAAEELQISRPTLHDLIKKHRIAVGHLRTS